jgi:hypothetical protein
MYHMGVLSEVVNVTDIRGTCWNIAAYLFTHGCVDSVGKNWWSQKPKHVKNALGSPSCVTNTERCFLQMAVTLRLTASAVAGSLWNIFRSWAVLCSAFSEDSHILCNLRE